MPLRFQIQTTAAEVHELEASGWREQETFMEFSLRTARALHAVAAAVAARDMREAGDPFDLGGCDIAAVREIRNVITRWIDGEDTGA
jgi:hypothetical protein